MTTITLKQQSAELACAHMKELAIKQRDQNHNNFISQINNITTTYPILTNMLNKEHNILKGYYIDKKNCVYKRPEYNRGEWENQFQTLGLSNELFNVQTKKR